MTKEEEFQNELESSLTEIEEMSLMNLEDTEPTEASDLLTEELATPLESHQAQLSDLLPGVPREAFASLTQKSQNFMLSLDKQLGSKLAPEVKEQVYYEMVNTLQEGQANSQTAKQLYGTPTETAATILEQEYSHLLAKEAERNQTPEWKIALDGGLMLGSLFTLITGISMLTAEEGVSSAYMGILTLIINYLVAGVAMLFATKSMPNLDAPKGQKGIWKYFGVSILAMLLWFAAVAISSAILPSQINPVLSAETYLIIGGITLVLRFVLKKQLNIQGTIF